jgi:hypothetical protein
VYPAAFPQPINPPQVENDPAEDRAWLTGEIVLEIRGHLSREEVLATLELTPQPVLENADIRVEHSARMAWQNTMPWAKTRVTINPGHKEVFLPETTYSVSLGDVKTQFTTIKLPKVVRFEAQNPPTQDLASVPTRSEIVLRFNEQLAWEDGLLQIDPPVPFTSRVEIAPDGGTIVRVTPEGRWTNNTVYTVEVSAAVEDVHGHQGGQIAAQSFRTEPPPTVVVAWPWGEATPIDTPVTIEFNRPVDRASVEAAFSLTPQLPGTFLWESDTRFNWRPQGISYSTWYTVAIGGVGLSGDAVAPYQMGFRTQDPPVFVQLLGRNNGPTMLEAIPSGGLGNYTYEWSTGQTANKILFKGEPGPQTVAVTVRSGDQTTTATMEVHGSWVHDYTPFECPEGWDMIEVSVCYKWEAPEGGSRRFITRVDLKDPGVQVRPALAGDKLGQGRVLSEASRARGALAAINGDFFYSTRGGVYPLGPIIRSGTVVSAPASRQAVLAYNRQQNFVWTGSATQFQLSARSTGDNWFGVEALNNPPGPNALAIFNANWGDVINLGAEGCAAVFVNPNSGLRAPDAFHCGLLTGIGIPAGGYVLVGRDRAADWLWTHAGNGIATGYASPLGPPEWAVGGSHTLVAGGVPTLLPADAWHPRSMIGVDSSGFLFMVVVEGYGENIGGMTLRELQSYAVSLGLQNAINLDGGGSAGMAVRGWLVNYPSDGRERAIASMVEVSRTVVPPCGHPFVRC